MSLKLHRLHLLITTSEGLYGVRLKFEQGLVIIWAGNSMGKSTCVQAIIYALGLERMLSPSAAIPLPHVMTKYVEDGALELPVLESEVLLEISNSQNECLTIQRGVGGERDPKLIRTWAGAKLSHPSETFSERDFFVRDPGAATHSAGFHHFLAEFVGWRLPNVSRYNGTEGLLYLESVFPLFVVEQKHGWAGIQSNLPTFLGIREMGKRAIEFVLNLDAYAFAEERQRLVAFEAGLRENWKEALGKSSALGRMLNGRISGIDENPTASWPPAVSPALQVFRESKWIEITEAIRSDKQDLARLEDIPIPTSGEDGEMLSRKLTDARNRLAEKEIVADELFYALRSEEMQIEAIRLRLEALREDLERNKDNLKLKSLGSIQSWTLNKNACPTCHQEVADSLLPQTQNENPMSLEDNVKFIQSQIGTFERLKENSVLNLKNRESSLQSVRDEIGTLRSQIRALRQTLVSANDAPSLASVRERVDLEDRIRFGTKGLDDFSENLGQFADISAQWKSLQEQKAILPKEGVSASDKSKLQRLQQIVRSELSDFGFQSVKPDSIEISHETYRPTREGFNLGFDLSASDNVRIIWAYLEGLLEIAREFKTNHLGILIFDEPGQQSTAKLSFSSLLNRASSAAEAGQQVIFATSEDLKTLKEMSGSVPHELHPFEGRIIKRLL